MARPAASKRLDKPSVPPGPEALTLTQGVVPSETPTPPAAPAGKAPRVRKTFNTWTCVVENEAHTFRLKPDGVHVQRGASRKQFVASYPDIYAAAVKQVTLNLV